MQIKIEEVQPGSKEIIFYDSYLHKDIIKLIPGRIYNDVEKTWRVPYNTQSVVLVNQYFSTKLPTPEYREVPELAPADYCYISHLYNHQKLSITAARQVNYFADLSEPGSGKTLVQIELMLERNKWPV